MESKPSANNAANSIAQIIVKGLDGKITVLDVNIADKIGDIKLKIKDKEGIAASEQRLTFCNKECNDDQCISNYDIHVKPALLDLVLRLKGGTMTM